MVCFLFYFNWNWFNLIKNIDITTQKILLILNEKIYFYDFIEDSLLMFHDLTYIKIVYNIYNLTILRLKFKF